MSTPKRSPIVIRKARRIDGYWSIKDRMGALIGHILRRQKAGEPLPFRPHNAISMEDDTFHASIEAARTAAHRQAWHAPPAEAEPAPGQTPRNERTGPSHWFRRDPRTTAHLGADWLRYMRRSALTLLDADSRVVYACS